MALGIPLLGFAMLVVLMAAFCRTASAQADMAPAPGSEMTAGAARSTLAIPDAVIWSTLLLSVLALLKNYY